MGGAPESFDILARETRRRAEQQVVRPASQAVSSCSVVQ